MESGDSFIWCPSSCPDPGRINVAQIEAVEEPELLPEGVFPADATTYLAFQAAASDPPAGWPMSGRRRAGDDRGRKREVVKVMNGLVRVRFANQGELLAAWESASSVVADPRPDKPVTDGTTPPAGTIPPTGSTQDGGTSSSAEVQTGGVSTVTGER